MKLGVHLPQWGPAATRAGVLDVARTAEAAGFDSVWVADHIVFPLHFVSRYPYRAAGLPFTADEGFLEAFTVLATVAGATERVDIGVSVLVLPMRETLLAAKVAATLDVLSGGRLWLAVGAGWWAEEFAAVGSSFSDRGRRLDEQLRVAKLAWTEGRFSFDGEHLRIEEVACLPLPARPGGPPVLVGGMGPAAWRRAGTLGDGWHAVGGDVAALAEGRAAMDAYATAAGRDPASLVLSTSTGMGRNPSASVDRLAGLANVGVDQAVLNPGAGTHDANALCAALEAFAGAVLPTLRAAPSPAGRLVDTTEARE